MLIFAKNITLMGSNLLSERLILYKHLIIRHTITRTYIDDKTYLLTVS